MRISESEQQILIHQIDKPQTLPPLCNVCFGQFIFSIHHPFRTSISLYVVRVTLHTKPHKCLWIVEIDSHCASQSTVGTRQQSGMSQYHHIKGLAWNEVRFCMLHSWLQVAMRITWNYGSQELASEQCPLWGIISVSELARHPVLHTRKNLIFHFLHEIMWCWFMDIAIFVNILRRVFTSVVSISPVGNH